MSESRLSRYRIERLLGEGAIGKVYLATDRELERPVALKLIQLSTAKAAKRDEVRARFQREAKLTARLQHPNIVVVYEFGEEEGSLFLAMEYVPGGTLGQRLAPGSVPFPLAERIVLAAEIAEAISHAHDRGVLHRDLKPANILLTASGDAKVSDFGIGRLLTGDVDLTATGEIIGSPAYMSPEQMRGERLDAKSDIFGLGVVLFHLLTGTKPFDATRLTALVAQIQNAAPPDPCSIDPNLPPDVGPILSRCLAKRKEDRYPDAGSLASDLRALLPDLSGAGTGLSSGTLRRLLSDTSGAKARRIAAPQPQPEPASATAVSTHVTPERASEILPTIQTGRRTQRRLIILLLLVAGAAVLLLGGLALLVRRPPAHTVVSEKMRERRPVATATLQPTAVPTAVPTPEPTSAPQPDPAIAFLADKHEAWPNPASSSVHAVSRYGLELHVLPGTARVFLDGKYIGIARDWDGHEKGSILAFPYAFRHVLRVVHPGYGDLEIDFVVTKSSRDEVAVVSEKLAPGSSSAPASLTIDVKPLEARSSGAVRLDVTPRDARVDVDGVEAGVASRFAQQDLVLDGPAVHTITLTAGGKAPVSLRVLVSPAVTAPRVTIRRRL